MFKRIIKMLKSQTFEIVSPNIYSQYGEDAVIYKLLCALSINLPSYLDIGAHHPISDSNTYLLYRNGSRGVLVEANPELIETIKSVREKDVVLNYGILDSPNTSLPFYIMTQKGWSTFSKEYAERAVKNNLSKIVKIIHVEIKDINEIINKYFNGKTPDFISIDVEQFDMMVLKSLDIKKYRPALICIEVSSKDEIREYMKNNDYVLWGCTYVNDIYLSNEKFQIIAKIHGWNVE